MTHLSPEDLLTQLQWRYATKQFDPDQIIPGDTWSAIEESLVLTPSSFGLQPWHFVVVESQNLKEELLPHSWNQSQVTECSHFVVLAAKSRTTDEEIDVWIDRMVEVRGGERDSLIGYRDMMVGFLERMDPAEQLQWSKLQTYIALGQLMTTASVLGIDACPMEGFMPAEYDRILGLPEKGLTASVACALGYRAEADKYASAPKARFPKKELLTLL
ncbi:MAG TPA: NAD(P)H-dependent oxidoreductase [Verrucomicrobiales bacterium]|nr:NAD(P)H-dependent oxidoreductase [Verrucomicrobiales bacterium]